MLTAFYRDVYPRRAAQAAGCRCSFQCESAAVASSTCVFYPLRHAQYLLLLLLACAHPSRICCPVCAHIHTCPPLLFSLSLSLFLRLIAKHVCSTRSRVLPCARYQEARACISPLGEEHRERGTGRRRRRAEGEGAEAAAVETGSGGGVETRENGGCVCACIKYIYARHRHVGEGS